MEWLNLPEHASLFLFHAFHELKLSYCLRDIHPIQHKLCYTSSIGCQYKADKRFLPKSSKVLHNFGFSILTITVPSKIKASVSGHSVCDVMIFSRGTNKSDFEPSLNCPDCEREGGYA
ncbi:hypothetical protein DPMN_048354 [Dreissena polymorpha]|uniref:Uncharacterized protein n=1 Tax=Dreissena polymorpha TaxID=45954 RepID=A0A9D4DBI2_DREPO|nr:hypothetical protein DPMN_048354 [Dreissena polymorpha]